MTTGRNTAFQELQDAADIRSSLAWISSKEEGLKENLVNIKIRSVVCNFSAGLSEAKRSL